MAVASGLVRDVAVIAESTFGTTPASPTFALMRVMEGSGMHGTKATEIIRQLSAHGNPVDLVQLGQDAIGSYQMVPVYGGAFETVLLNAIKQSTFTTNVAWNGRYTGGSMTFEEKVTGTSANYFRYTGVEVEQLDLDATVRQVLKATANVQAQDLTVTTTAITTSTYTAVGTGEVFTGLTVSSIAMLGLTTVPSIRSLKMSVKHALTPIYSLGNTYRTTASALDLIDLTGSIETIFEDKTAHDLFLNHSSGALTMTIGSTTNNKYTINMPKVYFQEGEISQAGTGPIIATFGFTAVYDGTNGSISITKAVA